MPSQTGLEQEITRWKGAIQQNAVQRAVRDIDGCREVVERLQMCLEDAERKLDSTPRIDVALLGPSRHGKSTLLNALAGADILPTSDVKPCSAAIISLYARSDWKVTITFVGEKELMDEKRRVVQAARHGLELQTSRDSADEADVPDAVRSQLQRFVQMYALDENLPTPQLIEQVEESALDQELAVYLGETRVVNAAGIRGLRKAVRTYLSTDETFWTVVERCDIGGPFEGWHPSLGLIDLPGTNDPDPHRTAVTNGLRDSAQAVAITTKDSNLGVDIESWLRNSSVLSQFVEATASQRQRLFIIKTHFDAFHPRDVSDESDDDDAAFWQAIEEHKATQAATYREMVWSIARPLLPSASTDVEQRKLDEIRERLHRLPVHFVSALAYEGFYDRISLGRRTRTMFLQRFDGDPLRTGVDELRGFLTNLASEYLETHFFAEIAERVESEVDLFVRFFHSEVNTLKAQLNGAGGTVARVAKRVTAEVLPPWRRLVEERARELDRSAENGASAIRHRLDQAMQMAERRLADKLEIWRGFAWNSLRATAQKSGVHTRYDGRHIDINNDICSVLVDDVLLAWSAHRDFLVKEGLQEVTDELARNLRESLISVTSSEAGDAAEAISALAGCCKSP